MPAANRIRPPEPLRAEAQSSPYPHTDARFPTNLVSVARVMPSLGGGAKMSNSDITIQTPVKYQQLPRQAATPGSLGPLTFVRYPRCFERSPSFGSWVAFSLGCQPGSCESAPFDAWVAALCTFHHCTVQVATDPQSPKGGSQRACPLGVPTPQLLGESKEWRCFSSRPC